MSERYYTHAEWLVQDGAGEEFVRLWREELAAAFLAANPDAHGTLIQSLAEPRLFYSFGPWESLTAMDEARQDPAVQEALGRLIALCESARPGPYREVLTLP